MSASHHVILKLERLAVGYNRQPVLEDIHLEFARGTFTALLGANGSGKSTLIKTVLGILPPISGAVDFPAREHGPAVLGYVPQRETLDPIFLLSSFEVVLMGVCGRVRAGSLIRKTERDWARECLKRAGADTFSDKPFSQLSGGQKQRVLIARALAAKPDLLLLDEPTSGIDVSAKQAIMELLRELHRTGQTIVMASHDLPIVRRYTERVVWLHEGKVEEGTVKELLSPERIEAMLALEMR